MGLRDYGTGTWEGGDEGCDHSVGGQVQQTKAGHDPNAVGLRPGVDAWNCVKCGARRIDSQIGLESSPDEWAARLVDVFREVRRVLRDDGTLWVECGDSYAQGHGGRSTEGTGSTPRKAARGEAVEPERRAGLRCSFCGWDAPSYTALVEHHQTTSGHKAGDGGTYQGRPRGSNYREKGGVRNVMPEHKPKDLIGQPWLLAFALRADGWFLRSCIIWSKPNAMPESVTDRPTTGHSYVFLFSKRPRYFYDAEALREPHRESTIERYRYGGSFNGGTKHQDDGGNWGDQFSPDRKPAELNPGGKNARTVWEISTEPNALAICRVCDAYWQGGAPREHCGEPVVQHFAAFPRELVRRMILAGTSERGVCGECGAPWVRETESELHPVQKTFTHTAPRDGFIRNNEGHIPAKQTVTTIGWGPSCRCSGIDTALKNHGGDPTPMVERLVPATVLDPFSGSGTTLLVARSLGRHSVGIELNERYCAMTRARLSQLSLLSELA